MREDQSTGILFYEKATRTGSVVICQGDISLCGGKHRARAIFDLDAEPDPTAILAIDGFNISGYLKMNTYQQSIQEADFKGAISIDGNRYAAGIWIPRRKLERKLVGLRLVAMDTLEKPAPRERPPLVSGFLG